MLSFVSVPAVISWTVPAPVREVLNINQSFMKDGSFGKVAGRVLCLAERAGIAVAGAHALQYIAKTYSKQHAFAALVLGTFTLSVPAGATITAAFLFHTAYKTANFANQKSMVFAVAMVVAGKFILELWNKSSITVEGQDSKGKTVQQIHQLSLFQNGGIVDQAVFGAS